MKFVPELPEADQLQLTVLLKSSTNFRVRQRSHALLLSARGYTIETLADIFRVHRNTVSEWIDSWLLGGIDTIEDAPRSGRPPSLTPDEQREILDAIGENPGRINEVLMIVKKKPASR
jgi:transposase